MNKKVQMKKAASNRSTITDRRFHNYYLLGGAEAWRERLGRNQTVICSTKSSLLKAIGQSSRESVWISFRPKRTEELLQSIGAFLASHRGSQRSFGCLFMLDSPRPRILPSLHGCFDTVIGEVPSFKRLPLDQLLEVFSAPVEKSQDVFIGGNVDRATGTLSLVRGDFERLIAPLSIFRPSGTLAPDFRSFELDDYGQTLRFGAYEATADVVLWETDPDYRKRAKDNERASAKGFGPSLRRLRKQRGLSQSDFPKVARKTISRLEKGEVDKPHATTRNRIAKTLGVAPEEIETY